jgi:hypothetical protein
MPESLRPAIGGGGLPDRPPSENRAQTRAATCYGLFVSLRAFCTRITNKQNGFLSAAVLVGVIDVLACACICTPSQQTTKCPEH